MIFFFIMKSSTISIIPDFPTSPTVNCAVGSPHFQGNSLREGL